VVAFAWLAAARFCVLVCHVTAGSQSGVSSGGLTPVAPAFGTALAAVPLLFVIDAGSPDFCTASACVAAGRAVAVPSGCCPRSAACAGRSLTRSSVVSASSSSGRESSQRAKSSKEQWDRALWVYEQLAAPPTRWLADRGIL
jgi:hypothetical protein